ncbi:MAG: hypothetical protein ABIH34_03220 [Nanoarchaeota archaeon]
MTEIEDYIIKELEKGFQVNQIVQALEQNGYDRDKAASIVEEIEKTHGKRALFKSEINTIGHILETKFFLYGLAPFMLFLLVTAVLVYQTNRSVSTILFGVITLLAGVAITSKTAEHVLNKIGFHNAFNSISVFIFGSGLVVYLLSLLLAIHPLLIGLLVVPLFFLVLIKEMGMQKNEAASLTVYVGSIGIISSYASLAVMGAIVAILKIFFGS